MYFIHLHARDEDAERRIEVFLTNRSVIAVYLLSTLPRVKRAESARGSETSRNFRETGGEGGRNISIYITLILQADGKSLQPFSNRNRIRKLLLCKKQISSRARKRARIAKRYRAPTGGWVGEDIFLKVLVIVARNSPANSINSFASRSR